MGKFSKKNFSTSKQIDVPNKTASCCRENCFAVVENIFFLLWKKMSERARAIENQREREGEKTRAKMKIQRARILPCASQQQLFFGDGSIKKTKRREN